ncbi:MAG: hypothetical protein ACYS21_02955, partial [Planctomycetota bacterium]
MMTNKIIMIFFQPAFTDTILTQSKLILQEILEHFLIIFPFILTRPERIPSNPVILSNPSLCLLCPRVLLATA